MANTTVASSEDDNDKPSLSSQPARDDEEKDAGWPARLLHMTSMKSFEKGPGNRYGWHESPEYCALSYTWGKYRLHDGNGKEIPSRPREMEEVLAIKITKDDDKPLDWSVPRIRPSHFTADRFRDVIKAIGEHSGTEWLWLDVACIDQRRGEGREEIGRQASIFGRASKAYIWLCSVTPSDWEIVDSTLSHPNDFYGNDLTAIENVFGDPWFASLWTLQEAYICQSKSEPELFVLASAGTENISPHPIHFPLLRNMVSFLQGYLENGDSRDEIRRVLHIVDRSGLLAIASRNPLRLYAAAAYRRPTNPTDYIYGIQQVFDIRLGDTAVNSQQGVSYTLRDLEDQFGDFLLGKYPVESQMHIFASAQDYGRGWHMSRHSRIPRIKTGPDGNSFDFVLAVRRLQEPLCKLGSALIATGQQTMGNFSGQLCKVCDILKATHEDGSVELFVGLDCVSDSDHVSADLRQLLKLLRACCGGRVHLSGFDNGRRTDLEQLERELGKIQMHGTRVLKLGKIEITEAETRDIYSLHHWNTRQAYEHAEETVISGLILQEETGYWRRLGICLWKFDSEKRVDDLAGVQWEKREGYFG